ncbi:MAG: o-succinylbenzoate synthase [Acidobacteriota bacterium]
MENIGKIDKAELFVVKIPLVSPFVTGSGTVEYRESLLLKLTSGEFYGWGECAAFRDPWYHYETIDTSLHIAETYLLPKLLRSSGLIPEMIPELYSWISGHNMSKAMIENSIIDLYAKKNDVPVFHILGGTRKRIRSGISLGITKDIDTLLGNIEDAVRKKYHKIKIKIRKGWDVNVVSAIRSSYPYINLTADANGKYSGDDVSIMKVLDKFDLKMIEQPLGPESLLEHSNLQKQMNTPLCLDESITGVRAAETAVSLKSCKAICVKQGRVGGLISALKIKDHCVENRVRVWCGGMLETGIGRAFNLHLQSIEGFGFPGDISETSRYFKEDIVKDPVVLDRDGYIELPHGNGAGIDVDEKKIEKFLVFRKKMVSEK